MVELFGEQWQLTLLAPRLVHWGVGLAPALLIRFVLVRRPIGDGWALFVAALFWALHHALVTEFGAEFGVESKPSESLALIAIVSYLILTAGRKRFAPVSDRSQRGPPKAASLSPAATSPDVISKKKVASQQAPTSRAPVATTPKERSSKLVIPKTQQSGPSATEEEAELHRYDIAWRELESGKMHRGLWGRAFVKTEGDEQATKIQYLKERVDFLKRVEQRQQAQRRAQKLRELEIQKQKERERFEQMLKSNRKMLRQKEEREHRELLGRIVREQSEAVNMLRDKINQPDKWNEYKLTIAAQFGSDEQVFALLAAGANPLLRDNFRFTARDYAKQKGRTEIARHLEIAERLRKQESSAHSGPKPGQNIKTSR